MNILYIDHYVGSVTMGMEFRPYYMAREWKKMGHNVLLVGADYSHVRTQQPEVPENFHKTKIDGVDFLFIQAGSYEGNGIKRALSMFKFVWSLWIHAGRLAMDFKPDIVISSSTYPLDAYAANRIAKKANGKYVHESHDVWPLTLIELGGMSTHHPFVMLLDRAERYAYRKAQKIVSILPGVLPHMEEQGLRDSSKFIYIPNGVVMEDWDNAEELSQEYKEQFKRLRDEGKFVVLYLGGHALSNALDQLLDAAKIANDVAFVLIGKGVEKSRLQRRAKDEKINNVYFLPPVPKTQVPNSLREADALYIGAAHSSLYRFGVSMNKLYDYMMSGKPILNGVIASNNDVDDAGCGLSFDSSKPEKIAEAVEKMRGMDQGVLLEMGKRGREWARENCDYMKLAKLFLEFMIAE